MALIDKHFLVIGEMGKANCGWDTAEACDGGFEKMV